MIDGLFNRGWRGNRRKSTLKVPLGLEAQQVASWPAGRFFGKHVRSVGRDDDGLQTRDINETKMIDSGNRDVGDGDFFP